MGLKLKLRPVSWDYPLVNVNKKLWKITIFKGQIHCKWQFSIAMFVYRRVSNQIQGILKDSTNQQYTFHGLDLTLGFESSNKARAMLDSTNQKQEFSWHSPSKSLYRRISVYSGGVKKDCSSCRTISPWPGRRTTMKTVVGHVQCEAPVR